VDVQVKNTAGRVTAENVSVNLEVTVTAGSIELKSVGGNIYARSDAGKILVVEPGGDVDARTTTGSIEVVSQNPLSKDYKLESATGRVYFLLPKESDLTIKAKSSIGPVVVDGLEGVSTHGGPGEELTHTLGTGSGSADLRVSTGMIKILVR